MSVVPYSVIDYNTDVTFSVDCFINKVITLLYVTFFFQTITKQFC